ncbi:MAG: DUF58 domain-containing protein [Micrococcaceae bacterium]
MTARAARFVPTAAGVLSLIGLVAGALLAAIWHWEGAAVIAVLLAGCWLCGIAVVFRRVSYRVEIAPDAARVVVGRECDAVVTVHAGRQANPPTVLRIPVGEATASVPVPRLRPGQIWRHSLALPTHRRQVLTLGPATAVRADPLQLMSRTTVVSEAVEIYVHPATVLPGYDATGLLRDIEGVQAPRLSPADVAFHALRDYVPGDDRRYIHWPTTARTGKMMVRQFEETRRFQHVVVLDTRWESYRTGASSRRGAREAAELAVSMAISVGLDAVHQDRDIGMWLTRGEPLPVVSARTLLDAAAEVEFVTDGDDDGARPRSSRSARADRSDAPSLAESVHQILRGQPQVSAVTVFTGSGAETSELRRAVQRIPVTATALVVQTQAPAPDDQDQLSRFQLEHAHGFRAARLRDLLRIAEVVR